MLICKISCSDEVESKKEYKNGLGVTSDSSVNSFLLGNFPIELRLLSDSNDKECLITSCNKYFKLDKSSCKCKKRKGKVCHKGCPKGNRIYALPNRINCTCV